jgi:hypothetical protein
MGCPDKKISEMIHKNGNRVSGEREIRSLEQNGNWPPQKAG